ncbi:MAG: hypothetical protein JWP01_4151 [Myxococcales bacterium]|nr:hypothetical protein [Myxococcales bacterium]
MLGGSTRLAVLVLAVAACARRPAPELPSERALFRDLERQVTVAAATGWSIDRLEVEEILEGSLDSVCRVDPLDRRALADWLEAEIRRQGGPADVAWKRRGRELSKVGDLLVLDRIRRVLARTEEMSLDCPFWLEPERPFRGRQISEGRWQISFGGGGKGSIVIEGENADVSFGGAGRLLLGRMFHNGNGLYLGAEIGGSAAFPRDEAGERTTLQLAADVVVPLVYRRTLTNSYVEFEAGWLGRSTEDDWGDIDHGVHVGVALGARALRTRFVFPGAALGISWERTFVDGADRTTIKVGARVAFDLDL